MADVFVTNEAPPVLADSMRWSTWRLTRAMVAAGWEVWGSSDGTSFSTTGTDYWTTYATSAANKDAWIALKRPGANQGHCFQVDDPTVNSGYNFRATETMSSWSATGVSASTAPLAVGQTGYVRGSNVAYAGFHWCANGTSLKQINYVNIFCADAATDGSFHLMGWRQGVLSHRVQWSVLDLPVEGILNPYVMYSGYSPTLGHYNDADRFEYNYYNGGNANGGEFWAFGTDGTYKSFASARYKAPDNYDLFYALPNGWQSDQAVITNLQLFQTTTPFSRLGIPRWIKIQGAATPTTGEAYKDKTWIQYAASFDLPLVLPWDGTSTTWETGSVAISVTDSVGWHEMVLPSGGGGGGGTARLPGNGYHRSRRRPRE